MMDDNQLIILVDALIYLATTIYWYNRQKSLNVGLIVLSIFTVSHIGAIFYYTILSELGLIVSDIQVLPFIYLYVMILLGLMPYLKFEGLEYVDDKGKKNAIQMISLIALLITIEPLLENIYLFLFSDVSSVDNFNDMRDGELDIYSSIGTRLNGWSGYFRIFVVVVFFYYLKDPGKKKTLLLCLGPCLLNYLLSALNTGARGNVVSLFLICLLCFVFYIPIYNRHTISKIKKYLVIVSIPLLISFLAVTITRYNDKVNPDKSLLGWLLLYSSEGPIKFNTEMWNENNNTNGDVNLCFAKDVLGFKTYTSYREREDHYIAKNGRRVEVFYTYVGDFLSDFGIYFGGLVCILLYLIAKYLLRKKYMPIEDLFIVILIIHIFSIGFASNIYRSYSLQKSTFGMFVIYAFIKFIPQKRMKRKCVL